METVTFVPVHDTVAFTSRQKQLVEMLAQGMEYKHIAHELGMTMNEVQKHLRILRIRHDCANSTHLVAKFLRLGIIK